MDLIFLQGPGGMDPGTMNLLFMGALFAVAYFFLIRPQAKRNREQQTFVKEIDKGDHIVTTSGIHGKIMEVDGDLIMLQIDAKKGITIKMTKAAISREMTAAAYSSEKEEEKK